MEVGECSVGVGRRERERERGREKGWDFCAGGSRQRLVVLCFEKGCSVQQ